MELNVLGSSSSGNCYLISNETECLIIEAGVKLKEVKKALDFDISKVVGVLVSHEHGDHAKYTEEYLNSAIPVYCSQGTIDGIKFKGIRRPEECEHGKQFKIGGFTVMPFDVQHDCNHPFGFIINHNEAGKILFLTDTFYSEYTFKGLNHLLVEANYCKDILEENIKSGKVHASMRNRLLTSHMSLKTCKELLSSNDLSKTANIVLIHLSSDNSNAKQFKEEVQAHTGKPTWIADKGLTILLNNEFNGREILQAKD